MKLEICAYCGEVKDCEREHAVPINLFPTSIRGDSRFVLVPSCRPCNRSFSQDEEDFRNYCTLAGPENGAVLENFHGPVLRGIKRNEGRGAGERLFGKMEFVEDGGKKSVIIYPDEKVFRVVRKIIRGLIFSRWGEVVPDSLVHAEAFPYVIPPLVDEFEEGFNQIHPSTFRYWCERDETERTHSGWFIGIYRTRNYRAWAFASEDQKVAWLNHVAENPI